MKLQKPYLSKELLMNEMFGVWSIAPAENLSTPPFSSFILSLLSSSNIVLTNLLLSPLFCVFPNISKIFQSFCWPGLNVNISLYIKSANCIILSSITSDDRRERKRLKERLRKKSLVYQKLCNVFSRVCVLGHLTPQWVKHELAWQTKFPASIQT